jgi:predicted DNA-binding transcriptional regulator YafY
MSFKFDSMMIILNKVDSGEKVTVQSLKEELRVSERTVHRYLETLQLSGYPLFFDRQSERYSFPEGYGLKKPGLTFEEALALALAKRMVGVFGEDLEKHLNRIGEKMAARPMADVPKIFVRQDGRGQGGDYLEVLNRAALNFQRVELTYQALSSRKKTRRRVEPDYLFYQEGLWYLRGFCLLREDFRTFALDQILSLKILDDYFVPRRRPEDEELSASFGSFLDGEAVDVVLRFDREIKAYIQRKKWHPSQQEITLSGGRLETRFRVPGMAGITRWIYRWLPHVEVIAPPELREKMKGDLKKALGKYREGARSKEQRATGESIIDY